MKRIIIFILLIGIGGDAHSQTAKQSRANRYYRDLAYASAAQAYKSLADQNLASDEDIKNLADSYYKMGDLTSAEPWYAKRYSEGKANAEEKYNYAQCLRWVGKWDESDRVMQEFSRENKDDLRSQNYSANREAILKIRSEEPRYELKNLDVNTSYADFGTAYYNDKIVFATSGRSGNSVRRVHSWNNEPFLNVYSGKKDGDQQIIESNNFRKKLNTRYHEGPTTFSADGKTMYFTRNNYFQKKFGKDAAGVNNLKIFRCKNDGENWSEEENFNYNSDEYSVGHPALSADGKTLYFVSDMPGGIGGTDIWKVAVNDDGTYGAPVNLGTSINTEGNEMFPFIHSTGMLFFSSNGLAGLGGLDVFAASAQGDGFSTPFNLGSPLNSAADDFAFILDQEQNYGYVSSNRAGGKGSDDIYSVKVITPIKPGYRVEGIAYDKSTGLPLANATVALYDKSGTVVKTIETGADGAYVFNVETGKDYSLEGKKTVYYYELQRFNTQSLNPNNSIMKKDLKLDMDPGLQIMGVILDKATGKPIEGAKVKVVKAGTPGAFGEFTTDANGNLSKAVEGMKVGDSYEYVINVEKEGYLNEMKRLPGTVMKGKNIEFRVDMNKLEVGGDLGKMVAINPIYFDKDKDFIRPDAAVELDKIVAVMQEYPNMVIELGSHTDCRASKSYNEKLSDRRAKSSAAYIISKGVDKTRIYGKGYGESELVNDCECEGNKKSTCSEEQHQMNRRKIFKIVKM